MNAALAKNGYMIAFVWGNGDPGEGLVRVYKYDFARRDYDLGSRIYPIGSTRCYWKKLVKEGWRKTNKQVGPTCTRARI